MEPIAEKNKKKRKFDSNLLIMVENKRHRDSSERRDSAGDRDRERYRDRYEEDDREYRRRKNRADDRRHDDYRRHRRDNERHRR